MEVITLGSAYVNWYLLRTTEGTVVIDAGFPGYFPQFEHALRQHQIDPGELKAVLLTHAHNDHIGCAEAIRQRYHIPVYVHEADQASSMNINHLPPWWFVKNCWRLPVLKSMFHALFYGKTFTTKPLKESIVFTDGDELPVPGNPIVIHTPGHTSGESCFYFREAALLFSGDALVTNAIFTGKEGEPQLLHNSINQDPKMAKESIEKLNTIGEITLYPGHGKSWKGNLALVIQTLAPSLY